MEIDRMDFRLTDFGNDGIVDLASLLRGGIPECYQLSFVNSTFRNATGKICSLNFAGQQKKKKARKTGPFRTVSDDTGMCNGGDAGN